MLLHLTKLKVGSCDADGVVKLWDSRMVAEIGTIAAGQHPLNSICFDRSATRMVAASNDGTVKVRTILRVANASRRKDPEFLRS